MLLVDYIVTRDKSLGRLYAFQKTARLGQARRNERYISSDRNLSASFADRALERLVLGRMHFVAALPEITHAVAEYGVHWTSVEDLALSNKDALFATEPGLFDQYEDVKAKLADSIKNLRWPGTGTSDATWVERHFTSFILVPLLMLGLTLGASELPSSWLPRVRDQLPVLTLLTATPGVAVVLVTAIRLKWFRVPFGHVECVRARWQLARVALSEDNLLPLIRAWVNESRADRLSTRFQVTRAMSLNVAPDVNFTVATSANDDIEELLSWITSGSIGIAGRRGTGKSTVLHTYCGRPTHRNMRDFSCVVSAPVNYASRDFILHLFAEFCRTTYAWTGYSEIHETTPWRGAIETIKALTRIVSFTLTTAVAVCVSIYLSRAERLDDIASWLIEGRGNAVQTTGVTLCLLWLLLQGLKLIFSCLEGIGLLLRELREPEPRAVELTAQAQLNLSRIRFLQSFTTGWSAGIPLVGATGGFTRSATSTEQPLSYPEIVGEFRAFAQVVATHVGRHGGNVFIGVDELDKIGSGDEAEKFLNEIKGIFGLPNVFFMVTVSDDALDAFERRGLPLRDTFDSSFDEIVHVRPLTYVESRRLLYRRIVGLNEPHIALCHCLSGGVARDLIRAARQTLRAGTVTYPDQFEDLCQLVVREEVRRRAAAVQSAVAHSATTTPDPDVVVLLHRMSQDREQLHSPVSYLEELIHLHDDRGAVDILAVREFLVFLTFSATLEEFFSASLTQDALVSAIDGADQSATLDTLALARYSFSIDVALSRHLVDEFRHAWGLAPFRLGEALEHARSPCDD